MAEPYDSMTTLLTDEPAAVRQFYLDGFFKQVFRFGRVTDKLFQMAKRGEPYLRIDGDGVTVQSKIANMHGTIVDKDLLGDFGTPRKFKSGNFKARFDENSDDNDFASYRNSIRVSHIDLERRFKKNQSAVDFAKEMIQDQIEDMREQFAISRNLPKSGQMGVVRGTPRQNNAQLFLSCTVTPAASTGVRFMVDGDTAIAYFQPGRLIDIYSSGGTFQCTLEVQDYNPADYSVGALRVDPTTDQVDSTLAIGSTFIDDNDVIYLHGAYNKNIISIGEWFATPVASENFYTRDRTTSGYRWLIPTKIGYSTAQTLALTDFNKLAIALGQIKEDTDAMYITQAQPALLQTYQNLVGSDLLVNYPSSDTSRKLYANYGFEGAMFHHPSMGKIMLQSDNLCPMNRIRFLKLGTWKTLKFFEEDIRVMPGDGLSYGNGWYRENAPTPNSGKGHSFRKDAIAYLADINLEARCNGEIFGVEPTAGTDGYESATS